MTRVEAQHGDLTTFEADAIVVNLFQGVKQPAGGTGAVDKALGGRIRNLIDLGDFNGKEGQVSVLMTDDAVAAPRVLLVGLGKPEDFELDTVRRVAAKAAIVARDKGWKRIGTLLHGAGVGDLDAQDAAQALTEGVLLGLYKYDEYKTKHAQDKDDDEPDKALGQCVVVEHDQKKLPKVHRGIERGTLLAESTNLTRTLIVRPSIAKPPAEMAKTAKKEAEKLGIKATVLTPADLKKLGTGLLLGVGSGAGKGREPRLVILDYKPEKPHKTVALIGKGITFDSGGINIKTGSSIGQMKYDMAGSATVLGAVLAAARLKVKHRVVALMALAENMPSGTAIRPGDILTAYDGTTVEVGNTDAEGRLVMGDAIGYALDKFDPDLMVDVATLTGAISVALGGLMTGVFGNDDNLVDALRKTGARTGDELWPMPLNKDYMKHIESDVADIKNVGAGGAGAIAAAAFLKHFVDKSKRVKWAHFDIAGTCWTDKSGSNLKKDYLPKGPTGVAVRLIAQWLHDLR